MPGTSFLRSAGDPDAAISQEEVVKKMTKEQIEKAHLLIDDYRVWLYPFR